MSAASGRSMCGFPPALVRPLRRGSRGTGIASTCAPTDRMWPAGQTCRYSHAANRLAAASRRRERHVARSTWAVGAREARNHAVLLPVLLWTAGAIFIVTGVGSRSAFGGYIWFAVSAMVTWQAIRVWRSDAPLEIRMAVLVLASVLVSPHMTIYDATALMLPLLQVGDLATTDSAWQPTAERLGTVIYWLFVTLLISTALLIKVQLSVFLMLALFWMLASQAASLKPKA